MKLEDEIAQKKFKNEYEKGYINLLYTSNVIRDLSKDFFKPYNITHQQYNILRILRGHQPDPATVNILKNRMLDKMCDASRMVERLRTKGLIKRTTSKDDRRSVDILITSKGLTLLKKIDSKVVDFENMMRSLSSNEITTLNKLLDKLREQ